MDSADYVRFYKIVDGGAKVLISQQMGAGTNTMVGTGIVGNKLKLRIETKVSFGDEYYYFDNLKVEDEVLPPTYTLTTSAPNGAITLNSAWRSLRHGHSGHRDGNSKLRIRVKQLERDSQRISEPDEPSR